MYRVPLVVPTTSTRYMLRYRNRVLGFLILLFAISYIDRVCISVAGPRMQEDLGISPVAWGWVSG
jgi:hypothetical protein